MGAGYQLSRLPDVASLQFLHQNGDQTTNTHKQTLIYPACINCRPSAFSNGNKSQQQPTCGFVGSHWATDTLANETWEQKLAAPNALVVGGVDDHLTAWPCGVVPIQESPRPRSWLVVCTPHWTSSSQMTGWSKCVLLVWLINRQRFLANGHRRKFGSQTSDNMER